MSLFTKALELVQRYGAPVKFALKTILGAVIPGSPAVIDLIEQAVDCVRETAKDQRDFPRESQPQGTPSDLKRAEQILDVLLGDLQTVVAQVSRLERVPELAQQIIDTALVTDRRCQEAAHQVGLLAQRFEASEARQRELLAGQEEMLPLLRRTVGVCEYIEELRERGVTPQALFESLVGFKQALAALGRGQPAEARGKLVSLCQQHPTASGAAALAAAQTADHQFLQAEQSLTQAVRLRPQDPELAELHRRATLLSRRGESSTPSVAPSRLPRQGESLDGWELRRLVGRGGWGQVYQAVRAGRTAALKALHSELSRDPAFVERFKREIKTLMQLGRHPHLVEIDTFGYDPAWQSWYYVMELIEGQSLEGVLAHSGPLAPEAARQMFLGVAEGLAAAHALGIVHRDVKPANIIVRPDGRPVLVDFGLAAPVGSAHTLSSAPGYTPLFAAPEQIRKGQADARSDVYSLAATLYYALMYGDPSRREPHCFKPAFVPHPFRALLTRALENDPADRPANARELLNALEQEWAAPPGAQMPRPEYLLEEAIGIETLGGVFHPLLARGADLPASRQEIFSTATENQAGITVTILAGNTKLVSEARKVGEFHLDGIPPAGKGVPQVTITVSVDQEGHVRATARDPGTGLEKAAVLGKAVVREKKATARTERHPEPGLSARARARARNDLEGEITISPTVATQGGKVEILITSEDGASQQLLVTIPPGVKDGAQLRLKGQGADGGDFYLRLNVR